MCCSHCMNGAGGRTCKCSFRLVEQHLHWRCRLCRRLAGGVILTPATRPAGISAHDLQFPKQLVSHVAHMALRVSSEHTTPKHAWWMPSEMASRSPTSSTLQLTQSHQRHAASWPPAVTQVAPTGDRGSRGASWLCGHATARAAGRPPPPPCWPLPPLRLSEPCPPSCSQPIARAVARLSSPLAAFRSSRVA